MTKPSDKADSVWDFMTMTNNAMCGHEPGTVDVKACIEQDKCARCLKPVNVKSMSPQDAKEYTISGYCSECQKWLFAGC